MRIFTAFCAAAALAFALHAGPAAAQAIKQIQLTDRHIEGFIAAQKDMAAVFERMQEGPASRTPRSWPSSRAWRRSTASRASANLTLPAPTFP